MNKKALLIIFLTVAVIGGGAVYYMLHKPHATVDDKKGIPITSETLSAAFISDEKAANTIYLNQILDVTGVVDELNQNQDKKQVVLLHSDDALSGVQCTMKNTANIKVGDKVTIKGFCNGYTTVVLLSDCIINK
jgi:hypothetical protein